MINYNCSIIKGFSQRHLETIASDIKAIEGGELGNLSLVAKCGVAVGAIPTQGSLYELRDALIEWIGNNDEMAETEGWMLFHTTPDELRPLTQPHYCRDLIMQVFPELGAEEAWELGQEEAKRRGAILAPKIAALHSNDAEMEAALRATERTAPRRHNKHLGRLANEVLWEAAFQQALVEITRVAVVVVSAVCLSRARLQGRHRPREGKDGGGDDGGSDADGEPPAPSLTPFLAPVRAHKSISKNPIKKAFLPWWAFPQGRRCIVWGCC